MASTLKPKTYLSPSDEERIKSELNEIRARRKATTEISDKGLEYYKPPEVDISESTLAAREQKLQRILDSEAAPRLPGMARNAAYREFNDLVKEWEENSLTKREQGQGYPEIMKKMGPDAEIDYERTKKKCEGWEFSERGQSVGLRLKELAGVIDPQNPELRNLENFRRRQ